MNTHELMLHEEPFRLIKEGKKTIEMRLNDSKRRLIAVGDRIIFVNRSTDETLISKVASLEVFSDFESLYHHFDHELLGYEKGEKGSPHDMEIYYSPDQIKSNGVLAIIIKSVNSENV